MHNEHNLFLFFVCLSAVGTDVVCVLPQVLHYHAFLFTDAAFVYHAEPDHGLQLPHKCADSQGGAFTFLAPP